MTISVMPDTQCLLTPLEQAALWQLVATAAPQRAIEIGTFRGGSAVIICHAQRTVRDDAVLVSLDSGDNRDKAVWAQTHFRAVFIDRPSPDGIPAAVDAAGGLFDLAFIDGKHDAASVTADLTGLLPAMTSGGVLLFHDAWHDGVRHAVDEAVEQGLARDEGIVAGDKLGTPGAWWGGIRKVVKA